VVFKDCRVGFSSASSCLAVLSLRHFLLRLLEKDRELCATYFSTLVTRCG